MFKERKNEWKSMLDLLKLKYIISGKKKKVVESQPYILAMWNQSFQKKEIKAKDRYGEVELDDWSAAEKYWPKPTIDHLKLKFLVWRKKKKWIKPTIDLSNVKSIVSGKRKAMKSSNASEEIKIDRLSKERNGWKSTIDHQKLTSIV